MLVRTPATMRTCWNASDAQIEQFLLLDRLAASTTSSATAASNTSPYTRTTGALAGQEFEHPTSQLTASTFVPRRVLYELRAGRDYFQRKERCVFCDIIAQEEQRGKPRMVERRGDYLSLCPYAPRVPYETLDLCPALTKPRSSGPPSVPAPAAH